MAWVRPRRSRPGQGRVGTIDSGGTLGSSPSAGGPEGAGVDGVTRIAEAVSWRRWGEGLPLEISSTPWLRAAKAWGVPLSDLVALPLPRLNAQITSSPSGPPVADPPCEGRHPTRHQSLRAGASGWQPPKVWLNRSVAKSLVFAEGSRDRPVPGSGKVESGRP